MRLGQEDTMSTTTEFSIVAVVIAALLGAAFHLNRVQAFPPVTAAYVTAAAPATAAEPATTGSTGR
jgi:TRAP-type C4-dicarboxylate transport system permease small subunit